MNRERHTLTLCFWEEDGNYFFSIAIWQCSSEVLKVCISSEPAISLLGISLYDMIIVVHKYVNMWMFIQLFKTRKIKTMSTNKKVVTFH